MAGLPQDRSDLCHRHTDQDAGRIGFGFRTVWLGLELRVHFLGKQDIVLSLYMVLGTHHTIVFRSSSPGVSELQEAKMSALGSERGLVTLHLPGYRFRAQRLQYPLIKEYTLNHIRILL